MEMSLWNNKPYNVEFDVKLTNVMVFVKPMTMLQTILQQ